MPTVAYLGPEHTNTHLAAQARFGKRSRYVHAPTVDDVFHLVERQQADFGVVPVENSLEGAVTHTLDWFIDSRNTTVTIHGEIEQPIKHFFIMHRGASLADIDLVTSHPQALAQCRRWLNEHLGNVDQMEVGSTAEAVEYMFPNDRPDSGIAAIGRKELVQQHRLQAIPIPIKGENKTRFLILGLGEPRKGRRNKTSVLFALKDRPGALYDALSPFKRERINLTKIESRPSKKKAWEYYFFIDLEGHESEPRVKRALAALQRHATVFKILGSYPLSR